MQIIKHSDEWNVLFKTVALLIPVLKIKYRITEYWIEPTPNPRTSGLQRVRYIT